MSPNTLQTNSPNRLPDTQPAEPNATARRVKVAPETTPQDPAWQVPAWTRFDEASEALSEYEARPAPEPIRLAITFLTVVVLLVAGLSLFFGASLA